MSLRGVLLRKDDEAISAMSHELSFRRRITHRPSLRACHPAPPPHSTPHLLLPGGSRPFHQERADQRSVSAGGGWGALGVACNDLLGASSAFVVQLRVLVTLAKSTVRWPVSFEAGAHHQTFDMDYTLGV